MACKVSLPREACSMSGSKGFLWRTDHVGTSCYATTNHGNWKSESQQWNQEHHQSSYWQKSILTSPDKLVQHVPLLHRYITTTSISNIKSSLRDTFPEFSQGSITLPGSPGNMQALNNQTWYTNSVLTCLGVEWECNPVIAIPAHPPPTPFQSLRERMVSIILRCSIIGVSKLLSTFSTKGHIR